MTGDRRKKNVDFVYDGDGSFPKDRIKGVDKRHWRRWRRREDKVTAREAS